MDIVLDKLTNVELSESQYHQDLWVLHTLNYKRNGFFVDVGAAHYQKLSNTYYLEKEFGWNGICIEGNGFFFEELVTNRSAKCVQAYVSTDTELTRICHSKKTPGDAKDHGFGDFLEDHNTGLTPSMGYSIITPKLLMDILIANNAPSVIDYLSIDIEGADFPVLQTIDFDRYTFMTITIEDNIPSYTFPIIRFLNSRGYTFSGKIGNIDLAFVYDVNLHKMIKGGTS
jgi:hypothetical protein